MQERDGKHLIDKVLYMIIPIRCFSCGALIADKYEEYKRRVKNGEHPAKVLDDMGIKRYCCRRMFLSQADYLDEIIEIEEYKGP